MLLEQGDETSAELQQAADDAIALATNHRKRGSTVAAIETDKIAASLSRAAAFKASQTHPEPSRSPPKRPPEACKAQGATVCACTNPLVPFLMN